ncbi:MAG: STAS domain-containing protein [Planctomycetota bacterium]
MPDAPLSDDFAEAEPHGDWIVLRPLEPAMMDQSKIDTLSERVAALVKASRARIILDLAKVEYISSSMVGALLSARKSTKKKGGETVLCGLNPRLEQLLKLVKLDKMFRIEPDAESALAKAG